MSSQPLPPPTSSSRNSAAELVFHLYNALTATLPLHEHAGLGGRLLYAGEITQRGRNLLYAANISGLASLAASADPAAQRQAMRDGVVDFVVNSLEEALRILKNEVRKRQTVSVAVAVDPRMVVEQMLDRGVLPDLLPPASWSDPGSPSHPSIDQAQAKIFVSLGAVNLKDLQPAEYAFITWSVDRQAVRWLPRLDASAQAVIPAEDLVRQRWLRLAPRYLGRAVQKEHGVALHGEELIQLIAKIKELIVLHQAEVQEPLGLRVGEAILA